MSELELALGERARVLFTTRAEGNLSSVGGEGAEHGAQARERLRERIGAASLARCHQEHGSRIAVVRFTPPAGERSEGQRPRADGQATELPRVAPMVLAADCLPVALAAGGAVCMIHAGWRGLAAGVLAEGVLTLRELTGAEPIVAAIGPAAGGCCYEVGPEVHTAFGGEHRHGSNIDLRALAHDRLTRAGVGHVLDVDGCTICDTRFFSHRREGTRAGRQAGVAWLS